MKTISKDVVPISKKILLFIICLCIAAYFHMTLKLETKPNAVSEATNPAAALHTMPKTVEKIPPIFEFQVTAYDLSLQSCGKPIGHPQYGITASGFSLKGHTRESAKTIAVDPAVIPLGSAIKIEFLDEEMDQYNGIYIARDTGDSIQGYMIDLFMGDFHSNNPSETTIRFGRRKALVNFV